MSEYDYIVVGAGSAGSIVAGRLAEDPSARVLLLEAGRNDRTPFIQKPGLITVVHTVPQVKKMFDWGYYLEPREETIHRKIPYTRGKVLGGSSAINGMIFVRGHRKNFDDWAADGAEGWSYEDVLPAYKRLENFDGGPSDVRGAGGPIEVTTHDAIQPVTQAFLEAVDNVFDCGVSDDYNGYEQEGIGPVQMNAKDGQRYSAAFAYVTPRLGQDNFDVVTDATVARVELEGTRAVGVTYQHKGQTITARATTEIVLSGGIAGSAQVLMLSGIGPASHLREHGIECIADLPVGDNLHDHLFFPMTFLAPSAHNRGTPTYFFGTVLKDMFGKKTWYQKTVFDSVGFVKSDPSAEIPDMQLHALPWAYPSPNQDAPVRPKVDTRPALTVLPTLIYPKSRGEVRLKSADPFVAPLIDPHFLQEQADVDFLMNGIERTREIMADAAIRDELQGELHPGPEYFEREALLKELPNRIHSVYHPVGTCRMGNDERAVVDSHLRVRGIEGLRVADASVMPSVIGGNTNAPAMMIGERCAEFIKSS